MAASLRSIRLNWKTLLEKSDYFKSIPKCRRCSAVAAKATESRKWQLHSAVCLQRFPVITQDMTPLEEKLQEHLTDLEVRYSYVSDHEIQEINEEKEKKKASEKSKEERAKEEDSETVTLSDMKRIWEKEYMAFQPADRTTEADKTNDTKSRDRKLDRKLILVVKHSFDNEKEEKWRLPQVERQEGESMRQTAERALSTRCGNLNATFIGNAPCGYLDYKLPQNSEEYGVKLFHFKAIYNKGEINLGDKVTDYRWLTLEELKDYLDKEDFSAVKSFMMEY